MSYRDYFNDTIITRHNVMTATSSLRFFNACSTTSYRRVMRDLENNCEQEGEIKQINSDVRNINDMFFEKKSNVGLWGLLFLLGISVTVFLLYFSVIRRKGVQ